MFGKNKVAALVAEFFGTAVLSMAILAMVIRSPFPFFAAATAGITVGVLTLVLGAASGAHLNPAVTLGLWSLRKVQSVHAAVFVSAQLLGGLVAWRLSELLLNVKFERMAEWGLDRRVLAAEILGSFIFTFGVASAVYNLYEGKKLATTIGGSLAIGIAVASLGSTGILNPAVAIGLNSVSWAYIIGPLLGGVLGMTTYSALFAPAPTKKKSKKKTRKLI